MNRHHNKQTSTLWSGRVYVTYDRNGKGGNVCIDPLDDDEFIVLLYLPIDEINENGIREVLEYCGYNPDIWLK